MMDPLMQFKHSQITSNEDQEVYTAIACNDQKLFNELHQAIDKVLLKYYVDITLKKD